MNTPPRPGPLAWLRAATPHERQTLLAGSLGWLLDAFDVMLYALVLTHLIPGTLDDQTWRELVEPDFGGPVAVGTDLMRVCG